MSKKENYVQKAEKFYDEKKFEDAIYWFTRAISERSGDAELYSERAVAHFHNGDLKSSLSDMNRAQELEPERAYRYASRAYIKDAMGDVKGAVEDYEIAVKLDPEDAVAHNNLGLLQEKLGYHQQAKVLFDFADELAKEGLKPGESPKMPKNIQREIDETKEKSSVSKEVSKALTTKKGFSEFLTFIRNGFK